MAAHYSWEETRAGVASSDFTLPNVGTDGDITIEILRTLAEDCALVTSLRRECSSAHVTVRCFRRQKTATLKLTCLRAAWREIPIAWP